MLQSQTCFCGGYTLPGEAPESHAHNISESVPHLRCITKPRPVLVSHWAPTPSYVMLSLVCPEIPSVSLPKTSFITVLFHTFCFLLFFVTLDVGKSTYGTTTSLTAKTIPLFYRATAFECFLTLCYSFWAATTTSVSLIGTT